METAGWDTGCELQSAQSLFEKGEAALCESKHSEAAEYFGEALKADPFNARVYSRLSRVFWAQGKIEDALNSLTRALELEPGDRDTVIECTRIFKALGKEDYAKEVVESYLERNPYDKELGSLLGPPAMPARHGRSRDAAEFLRRHGEIEFERGNIQHAVACFEMAIEEDPRMAEAYNNLGVINLENGKMAEALENFYKALELKPGDAVILGNSARGLAMAAQTDAAIEIYREYLRRSPEDSKAWLEFESLIRRSTALGWSPKGLPQEVADIYLQTARSLGEAGDLTGATEAIQRTLKIKPATPESLYVLASLHCAIGQKDEAEAILDKALMIDPSHGPCLEMLESLKSN